MGEHNSSWEAVQRVGIVLVLRGTAQECGAGTKCGELGDKGVGVLCPTEQGNCRPEDWSGRGL